MSVTLVIAPAVLGPVGLSKVLSKAESRPATFLVVPLSVKVCLLIESCGGAGLEPLEPFLGGS